MSIIRRMPNPEHMARAAVAIRARWEAEASFQAAYPAVTVNIVPIRRRVGVK